MAKPFISILVPAFKSRHFKEAVSSIIEQTYQNFELIIINDLSPENIDQCVGLFQDERIVYHKNKQNIGKGNLVAQWNHCVDYAQGEWLVMASDDDIYEKTYLEEMVSLISRHPNSNVFHCNIRNINDQNQVVDYSMPCSEEETAIEYLYYSVIRNRLHALPEYLFRARMLKQMGGFISFPAATCSDTATIVMLAQESPIICSDKYLFNWRNNGENISSNTDTLVERLKAIDLFYTWCVEFVSNLTPQSSIDKEFAEIINNRLMQTLRNSEYDIIKSLSVKQIMQIYNTKPWHLDLINKEYLIKHLISRLRDCIFVH